MFDWNDEELTNIIWDEAGEGGDHSVPYSDASEEKTSSLRRDDIKKEWNHEFADAKPAEQKKTADFRGIKIESISHYDISEGLSTTGMSMDSCPDLSLSNAAKTDQGSIGTEASNSLTEIARSDLRHDSINQPYNGSEMFQNQWEDGEEGNFVDCGWANIGSFDDFDRIFSNEDPMYGSVSLGSVGELWSSSKDAPSHSEKSILWAVDSPATGGTSDHFEIKAECMLDQNHSCAPSYKKANHRMSDSPKNAQAGMDQVDFPSGKNKSFQKDKTFWRSVEKIPAFNSHVAAEPVATTTGSPDELFSSMKLNCGRKILKSWENPEDSNLTKQLLDTSDAWSSHGDQFQQFDGQDSPLMAQACSSPILSRQRKLQGPESSQYQHFLYPSLVPNFGNVVNQISATPALPHCRPGGDNNHQLVSSFHDVPSANSAPDVVIKPLMMTPQEKIEKLRRQQQIRAMLAIQEQQLQLRFHTEQSIPQQCSHGKHMLAMEGRNIEENVTNLSSLAPNSPVEQHDSNSSNMEMDDYSVEDTIIYRLREIIEKMDIQIRHCIRDSLFRLAQSAMQRQCVSDTTSINKSSRDEFDIVSGEEINNHNRLTSQLCDVESETNPIDRTVARFLFHRHLDFSANDISARKF